MCDLSLMGVSARRVMFTRKYIVTVLGLLYTSTKRKDYVIHEKL